MSEECSGEHHHFDLSVLLRRYFARSEIGVLGLHFLPLGGIQTATAKDLPKGCPMVSSSGPFTML